MLLVVLPGRIELTTSPLPRGCSTTELRQPSVVGYFRRGPATAAILAIRLRTAQGKAGRTRLSRSMVNRPDPPQKSPRKTDQQRRLSAALRENLKRRKAQAKGRHEGRHQAGEGSTVQLDLNSH